MNSDIDYKNILIRRIIKIDFRIDRFGNIFHLTGDKSNFYCALTIDVQVFITHQTEYNEYNRSHGVPGHPLSSLPKDQTKG